MADGADLPPDDDVLRAGGRGYDEGQFTASAFTRNKSERDNALLQISAEWVQCQYVASENRNIADSVQRLLQKNVRPHQPGVAMNVGRITDLSCENYTLSVIEDHGETGQRFCHCVISGFTGDETTDLEIATDLADLANESEYVEIEPR